MALEQTMTARQIADRWWVPLIRGIAAVLFGILTLAFPGLSLMALILMWGAYALVDGVFSLVMAYRRGTAGASWGWLVFEGLVGIGAGVAAFVWPGMTVLILLMVIGVWAILTGIAEIAAAIRLRKDIEGEWMLATSGVLSIILGGLLFAYPGAGTLALLMAIGIYAIVFGMLLMGLAWRLHRWRDDGTAERRSMAGTMGRETAAHHP